MDSISAAEIITGSEFDYAKASRWTKQYRSWAVGICVVYVIGIFTLKSYMKNRKPLSLRIPLNIWNFFLALFSIVGTIKMMPDFFGAIQKGGLFGSYCHLYDFFEGVNGYWVWAFAFSKSIELGDTVFLVLRKRPLMFLHWYHHVLTLTYAIFTFHQAPGFQRWGIGLNYFVHAFMYSYYFLRSLRVKVPAAVSQFITSLQILQFVVSFLILTRLGLMGFEKVKAHCDFNFNAWAAALFMDGSYLVLFINFFYHAYVKKDKKKTA